MRGFKMFVLFVVLKWLPAGIPEAKTWLRENQDTTGYWEGTTVNRFDATSYALQMFCMLDEIDSSVINGINWFIENAPNAVPYLSDKIMLCSYVNIDYEEFLDTLLAFMNEDAGFGVYKGYKSDIIDACRVLFALKEIGYPEYEQISSMIQYILSMQDTTGGFYISEDVRKINIFTTSLTLLSLLKYRDAFDIEENINSGISYILSHQEQNGSFNNTVYETSLALLVLIASEKDYTVQIQKAVQYLISKQDTNGSWNNYSLSC